MRDRERGGGERQRDRKGRGGKKDRSCKRLGGGAMLAISISNSLKKVGQRFSKRLKKFCCTIKAYLFVIMVAGNTSSAMFINN